ncbi:MAG: hypothetical protein IH867_12550 [Chloroflexi bacterium]|nr:hypothetical protein [Chloroflexota bacterium]
MASEARESTDIIWSAPDVDLSDGKLLAEVRKSVANAPSVTAVKVFLISRHQVVIRIESQASREQLVKELDPAFGPKFGLRQLVDAAGDHPRLVVVPRSDSERHAGSLAPAPAPAADSDPDQADQPVSSASRPTTALLDGLESIYKKFRLASGPREIASKRPWTRRTTALALVLALVVWFMLPPVFNFRAVPWGVDQWAHLTRLELLRESVATNLSIPMWLPNWYSGQDLWQYYPPLTYFLLLPAALLTGDALSGYTLLATPITAVGAVAFLWAFRPWLGNGGAFLGALIFVLVPPNVSPMYGEGNIAWGIQQSLLPINIGLLLRSMHSPRPKTLIFYGLTVGLMIVAHSMMALLTIMATVALAVGIWATGRSSFRALFWTGAASACGAGAVAFWLVPGITNFDLYNVPALVGDKVVIWSSSSYLFDRATAIELLGGSGAVPSRYLGFMLPAAATLGVVAGILSKRYRPVATGFTLMALTTFVIGLGVESPFWSIMPMADSLLPNRAFNITVFAAAFLIPLGFKVLIPVSNIMFVGINKRKSRLNVAAVGVVIVMALFTWEYAPWLVDRSPSRFVGDEIFDELVLDEGDIWSGGRYWDLTPVNDSRQHYTVTVQGKRMSVIGWANEGSLHADEFTFTGRELAVSRTAGLVRRADIYNTEFVWIEDSQPGIIGTFAGAGFSVVNDTGLKVLMQSEAPQSYLFEQDRKVLAVGADATMLAAVIPSVVLGTYERLNDYPEEYLNSFETIFIAAPGLSESASELRDWVERRLAAGQRVLLDPTTPGSGLVGGFTPVEAELRGSFDVVLNDGSIFELGPFDPMGEPFVTQLPARIHFPDGEISVAGATLPFIGRSESKSGELIILPFAIVFHSFSTPENTGLEELLAHLMRVGAANTQQPYPRIDPTNMTGGKNAIELDFEKITAGYVVLSMTYSPHWRATVNGEAREVIRHENMIAIRADQGVNSVVLNYRATPVQLISAGMSILALLSLVLVARYGPRSRLLDNFEISKASNLLLVRFPQWIFQDETNSRDRRNPPGDE